jgi:site-specific DNA recombinase
MQSLRAEGIRSRKGQVLSRGALYGMLSNPIYIGKIRHKDAVYDGVHEAIIAQELWDAVQQRLTSNRIGTKTRSRKTQVCPLTNKLFDVSGERLLPVHALKKGRRYRYYISESLKTATRSDTPDGWRLPGQELEQMVAHAVVLMLQDGNTLTTALQSNSIATHHIGTILAAAKKISTDTPELIERFVQRVALRHDGISITLTLVSLLPSEKIIGTGAATEKFAAPIITRDIPMRMKRRGVEMRLVIGGECNPARTDAALIKTIARAHAWFQQLATGRASNIAEIAMREGMDRSYATRILNLAFLAPDMIERIIAGQQPADLTIEKLTKRMDLPVDWAQQREMLGCV